MRIRTDPVLHINDSSVYKVLDYYRGKKGNPGGTQAISPTFMKQGWKLCISELNSYACQWLFPLACIRIYTIWKLHDISAARKEKDDHAELFLHSCITELLVVWCCWLTWMMDDSRRFLSKSKGKRISYLSFLNWEYAKNCRQILEERMSHAHHGELESYFPGVLFTHWL